MQNLKTTCKFYCLDNQSIALYEIHTLDKLCTTMSIYPQYIVHKIIEYDNYEYLIAMIRFNKYFYYTCLRGGNVDIFIDIGNFDNFNRIKRNIASNQLMTLLYIFLDDNMLDKIKSIEEEYNESI